jgi:hypothetical protein
MTRKSLGILIVISRPQNVGRRSTGRLMITQIVGFVSEFPLRIPIKWIALQILFLSHNLHEWCNSNNSLNRIRLLTKVIIFQNVDSIVNIRIFTNDQAIICVNYNESRSVTGSFNPQTWIKWISFETTSFHYKHKLLAGIPFHT